MQILNEYAEMRIGDVIRFHGTSSKFGACKPQHASLIGATVRLDMITVDDDGDVMFKVSGPTWSNTGKVCFSRFAPLTPASLGSKPQVEGKNMLNDLRSYVKDNRQLLYTIALVVALDHFLFNGAFRERIKGLVESLLSSAEKKIGT